MPRKTRTRREIKQELETLRAKFRVSRDFGRLSAKDDACLRMAIDVLDWVLGEVGVMSPSELTVVDPLE